ncbi:MAG: hypothetical protein ACMZ63_07965 [Methylotenera sp.]
MNQLIKVSAIIYGVLFFLINSFISVSVYLDNGVPPFTGFALLIPLITLAGVIKKWFLPLPVIMAGVCALIYALKDAHVFASLQYVTLGSYIIFGPMLLIHAYALVRRLKQSANKKT